MKNITTSQKNGLRSFYVNDREIDNINFYKNGQITLHIRNGWIEPARVEKNYRSDMNGLLLVNDVRRSTKLNLDKGGHFYINEKNAQYSFSKMPRVSLYIDTTIESIAVSNERTVVAYTTIKETVSDTVVDLTATFGRDGLQTIPIYLRASESKKSTYGESIAALNQLKKELAIVTLTFSDIIQNDKLFDLIVSARLEYKNATK